MFSKAKSQMTGKNTKPILFSAIIISVLAIAMIGGCKKKNTTATKTELLTQKSWKLSAARHNTDGASWIEEYSITPDCTKDNLTTYKTDGTYIIDEGATLCNTGDPQTFQQGTWVFGNNESRISQTCCGGAIVSNLEIVQLDAATLKATLQTSPNGGNLYPNNFEYTYTHP